MYIVCVCVQIRSELVILYTFFRDSGHYACEVDSPFSNVTVRTSYGQLTVTREYKRLTGECWANIRLEWEEEGVGLAAAVWSKTVIMCT